jgi:hypothetical protein
MTARRGNEYGNGGNDGAVPPPLSPGLRRGAISKFPEEAHNQVVTVTWDDSWGAAQGAWEMRGDNITLFMPPVVTLGFLVAMDEAWVAIAQSIADFQLGHVLRIARGSIQDITVLNVEVKIPEEDKSHE